MMHAFSSLAACNNMKISNQISKQAAAYLQLHVISSLLLT
jgi:hypothetical protein